MRHLMQQGLEETRIPAVASHTVAAATADTPGEHPIFPAATMETYLHAAAVSRRRGGAIDVRC